MTNAYGVGIGGFVITALYVIIIAFLWRVVSAKMAASDNSTIAVIGSAMGSTL